MENNNAISLNAKPCHNKITIYMSADFLVRKKKTMEKDPAIRCMMRVGAHVQNNKNVGEETIKC